MQECTDDWSILGVRGYIYTEILGATGALEKAAHAQLLPRTKLFCSQPHLCQTFPECLETLR